MVPRVDLSGHTELRLPPHSLDLGTELTCLVLVRSLENACVNSTFFRKLPAAVACLNPVSESGSSTPCPVAKHNDVQNSALGCQLITTGTERCHPHHEARFSRALFHLTFGKAKCCEVKL